MVCVELLVLVTWFACCWQFGLLFVRFDCVIWGYCSLAVCIWVDFDVKCATLKIVVLRAIVCAQATFSLDFCDLTTCLGFVFVFMPLSLVVLLGAVNL